MILGERYDDQWCKVSDSTQITHCVYSKHPQWRYAVFPSQLSILHGLLGRRKQICISKLLWDGFIRNSNVY